MEFKQMIEVSQSAFIKCLEECAKGNKESSCVRRVQCGYHWVLFSFCVTVEKEMYYISYFNEGKQQQIFVDKAMTNIFKDVDKGDQQAIKKFATFIAWQFGILCLPNTKGNFNEEFDAMLQAFIDR